MIYANGHFCKWDSNSDRADANSFQKNICPSDKSSEAHRNSLVSDDRIHAIPIVIRYNRTSQTNSAVVRRYLWFDGHSLPLRTAQVLSRFPTQNRRDQSRQQPSAGTARPSAAAIVSGHHPPNRGSNRQRAPPAQARQRVSAGTARQPSKQIAPLSGAICGLMGTRCRFVPHRF